MKHALAAALLVAGLAPSAAQTPPSPSEISAYQGLHRAAHEGDVAAIKRLAQGGADLNARDSNGRTPFHVACFAGKREAMAALAAAKADTRALDNQRYDCITIASVADDLPTLDAAIAHGGDAKAITSPYEGTALIAAAHLGHDAVVARLIQAGAPLDHVNNLGWTALIESVVLGQGGPRHIATATHLVKAGARRDIADRSGNTPLQLAQARGFDGMVKVISAP